VGLYALVMAEEKVLFCSVLTVGDHGCYRYILCPQMTVGMFQPLVIKGEHLQGLSHISSI
jgi:hypothetical protein